MISSNYLVARMTVIPMVSRESKCKAFGAIFAALVASAAAERSLRQLEYQLSHNSTGVSESNFFLWQADELYSGYQHVWPGMVFDWRIVVGTVLGFLGSAFGSVGGVGGGGIFFPMLSLIIGFDPKSSTAISKCMIMGGAISAVYYNLKLRHPTIDMPIIEYDLVVLIMPVLMMGISIGVTLNVIFADWMLTVLLIILFIVVSMRAFLKGVETWKEETIFKVVTTQGRGKVKLVVMPSDSEPFCFFLQEKAKLLQAEGWSDKGKDDEEYKLLQGSPSDISEIEAKDLKVAEVGIIENVHWKQFGLLVFVWLSYLTLQIIAKTYTSTCSVAYWVVNLMQIPVSFGVSGYQVICLNKGWRKIESKGDEWVNLKVPQLISFCFYGVMAGMVGGLLGQGSGFIMGPVFLELGIHPQVASATATLGMMFSSSMSVVEYYLLKRFPVPYALYLVAVATVAAFIGQDAVRRLVTVLGRSSIIIFILSFTIFVSAVSLGGAGISNMIGKIGRQEYMGFENLCKY